MTNKKQYSNLNDFEKLENIGKGGFSEVYKVKEKETKKIYAAKILMRKSIENSKELRSRFLCEVNINSKTHHPSVLQFIGYCPIDFEQRPRPVIITQYLQNGSLQNLIHLEKNGKILPFWDETMKLVCIYGIAVGMQYLHSNGITHLDLKPGNVLMDEYLFPKIADFGLSKVIREDQDSINFTGTMGTPKYIAPEVWKKSQYTKAADVYAFAIIVYQILTKLEPFQRFDDFEVFEKVMTNNYRPEFNELVSDAFKELIEKCWSNDPNDRPTFEEIVTDLKYNADYITGEMDSERFQEFVDFIDSKQVKKEFDFEEDENQVDNYYKLGELEHFEKMEELRRRKLQESSYDLTNFQGFNNLCEEAQQVLLSSIKKENIESKQVCISSKNTNFLHMYNSLTSPDFVDILSYFDEIMIEIEFPSNDFESIYNSVLEIKKGKMEKIQIKIVISIITSIKKDAFIECNSFTEVSIPSSVTSIEENAFKGCSSLVKVIIPSSVIEIKEGAFCDCSSLTEFVIPSSVTRIGSSVFKGCKSLTKIEIPSSIETIENSLFYGCSSLKAIQMPFQITSIGDYAFYECSSLSNIIIPYSVKSIGQFAFCDCSNLAKLSADQSKITAIKNSTFQRCSSLGMITIPSAVTDICENAFAECSNAKIISLSSSLVSIGNRAFKDCSSLIRISIPPSVKKIGIEAFSGCSALKEVVNNSLISVISEALFKECSSMVKADIPPSVTSIGKNAFFGCSSLQQISIPANMYCINDFAFCDCKSLQEIIFPFMVKRIAAQAFTGCSLLLEEEKAESFVCFKDKKCFCNCKSFKKLAIAPNYTSELYSNGSFKITPFINALKMFESISVYVVYPSENYKEILSNLSKLKNESLPQIKIVMFFSGIKKIDDFYDINDIIDEIQIDSSVEAIGFQAFRDFLALKKVKISSSVTSIGEKAFQNCSSLKIIKIPSSVISLGWGAFIECTSLEKVKIPSSIKIIPEYLFYKCSSLNKVVIPFSVTRICKFAFLGCTSLSRLPIPTSVVSIDDKVFEDDIVLIHKVKSKKKGVKKIQQDIQADVDKDSDAND